MSAPLVTLECVECERQLAAGAGDGWAFDGISWNATARAIVDKHERRYGHTVRVIK